ncbi:MAG: DUF4359 domain-containing protein [Spirulinaceae cyanobacterium]
MKFNLISEKSAIALAILCGGMAIANPNPEAYTTYASVQLNGAVQEGICQGKELPDLGRLQGLATTLGQGIGELCKTAIASSGTLGFQVVQNYIEANTTRQNFLIFSIYQTKVPDGAITTVAGFNNFKTLPRVN